MQVKAKGMLLAVALSLCCMGCGAQKTPALSASIDPASSQSADYARIEKRLEAGESVPQEELDYLKEQNTRS